MAVDAWGDVSLSSRQLSAGELLAILPGEARTMASVVKDLHQVRPPRFRETRLRLGRRVDLAGGAVDELESILEVLEAAAPHGFDGDIEAELLLAHEYANIGHVRLSNRMVRQLASIGADVDISFSRRGNYEPPISRPFETVFVGARQEEWAQCSGETVARILRSVVAMTFHGERLVFPTPWSAAGAGMDAHLQRLMAERHTDDGLPVRLVCLVTGEDGRPAAGVSSPVLRALTGLNGELDILVRPVVAFEDNSEAERDR